MIENNRDYFKRLAIGTVQFGTDYGIANQRGKVSIEEAREILEYAYSAGVKTLDTAIVYGSSETVLGQIGVRSWQVVSKLTSAPKENRDLLSWVEKSVFDSLQRLNILQLYGLLLHQPKQLLQRDGESLFQALTYIKQQGLVNKIGISIYAPDELDKLFPKFTFDLVQIPCNIIDRRFSRSGWLSRLKKAGVEVHARSVFLQGLLLMNSLERPQYFTQWNHLWQQWEDWLHRVNLTPLEACLGFVFLNENIDRVLVGVDSLNQLKEILNYSEKDLFIYPDYLECDDPKLVNPSFWRFSK